MRDLNPAQAAVARRAPSASVVAFLVACWLAFLAHAMPAFAQALAPGAMLRDCRDCPELIVVPAGQYSMGSSTEEHARFGVTPEYAATELPAHGVRIARPFAVGRYAVTRDEWARYAQSAAGQTSAERGGTGCAVLTPATGVWAVDAARSWRDPGYAQTGREPVVCISWNEAQAYAAWLSQRSGKRYRLLTEAEWEYAARAGSHTANYWGSDASQACAHANASDQDRADAHAYTRAVPDSYFPCRDGHVHTAPVDAYGANAFGLYGMSGNVWQWVEDCFNDSHAGAPADGSARRDGDCRYRVDRGASWVNSPRFVRAAARHKDLVEARTSVLGLRLARDLVDETAAASTADLARSDAEIAGRR